jgi:predicted MFS family arabinose efflux permease
MPVVPPRSLPVESSHFRHLTTLATTPCFLPLVSASLFVGLGNAVGGSYLTLFVIDKAHLSPLALGVFLTVYSLSGMIISTSFGRWFDRTPSPIPLLLALVMTISGYALLSVTTIFIYSFSSPVCPSAPASPCFRSSLPWRKGILIELAPKRPRGAPP